MKNLISILLIAIALFCLNSTTAYASTESDADTVILASTDDPYYSLAEEISLTEGISVYQTFEDTMEAKPVFLLWVISPENLSESVLMDFSNAMNGLDTFISVGIISGKTIDDARSLWKGSSQVPGNDFAIINGTKKHKIEPEIIYGSNAEVASMELTMVNILTVLQNAEAIQISLEGAAGLWFDKSLGITVKSADIPELNACVIQNYGCSTFKPWEENSIALECISKGAIAYCGFLYSSVAGTRFGDYTDISTIYTWDKYPLGHLVQIQNHAAMQSYAVTSHYFMLGDPRLYCSSEAPYEILSDEASGDTRTIKLSNVKSGLIPIYIEDGAGYDSISIPGLTYSIMDSAYSNSRLQMIDINDDKYIVINNDSSSVTIEMQKKASLFQTISSNSISFLDSIITKNQGSNLSILLMVPVLILFIIGLKRKRYMDRELIAALIFGAAAALMGLSYILMRSDNIVVTNIPIKVNWFYICGIFIFTGYGELLYVRAKKPTGKIVAILAANLNAFVTLIVFAVAMFVALLLVGNTFGINKPGYPWLFTLKELSAGGIIMFAAYYLFNKLPLFRKKLEQSSGVDKL